MEHKDPDDKVWDKHDYILLVLASNIQIHIYDNWCQLERCLEHSWPDDNLFHSNGFHMQEYDHRICHMNLVWPCDKENPKFHVHPDKLLVPDVDRVGNPNYEFQWMVLSFPKEQRLLFCLQL